MANTRTVRTWNYIWDKVNSFFVGGSGTGVESPFGSGPVLIEEPLTLYVETTGNDANPGTLQAPFRTVQAALNYLEKFEIRAHVDVNLGLGIFDGFTLPDIQVGHVSGATPALTIKGTLVEQDTGTATSQTPTTSNSALFVITDTTKSWSVDQWANAYIEVSFANALTCVPIVSNTATTVTFNLSSGSNLSSANYRIVTLGTQVGPTGVTSSGSETSFTTINVHNVVRGISAGSFLSPGGPLVNLQFLDIRGTSTNQRCLTMVGPSSAAQCTSCTFSNPGGTGSSLVQVSSGRLSAYYSLIMPSGSTAGVTASTSGTIPPSLNMFNSTLRTAGTGTLLLGWYNVTGNIAACYFTGASTTGASIAHGSSVVFTGSAFNTLTTGLLVFGDAIAIVPGVNFTSCTTGLSCVSASAGSNNTGGLVANGSGNTTCFSATMGGKIRIAASTNITGTTELSVDGTGATLATMRGNSPKVQPLTPNAYGSYCFE